jgi:hypothetical protein
MFMHFDVNLYSKKIEMNQHSSNLIESPIDVVIAWVDGNDPKLIQKRNQYIPQRSVVANPGAHPTRFASVNEIRYCVLSILRFAPFVRNIFIVTDGQDPDLYEDIKKYFPEKLNSIRIVDHTEIFEGYEKFLPTFNSISIAHMIWRIKGLADNFIYFNDDTFLVREVKPEEWFVNNKPVIRGNWVPAPYYRILWDYIKIGLNRYLMGKTNFKPRASFKLGQWNSASLLGFKTRYFKSSHTAHTANRKVVEDFFLKNELLLKENLSHRFRETFQFTFIALSNHLQLQGGNKNTRKPGLIYLQPNNRGAGYIDSKIRYCEKNHNVLYMCVQSMELCTKEVQDKVFGWLEKILELK